MTTDTLTKCDCCEEQAHDLDLDDLCIACEITQAIVPIIERETELSENEATDLACDIGEAVRSAILSRLVDRSMPLADFIADIGRGMVAAAN